MINNIVLNEVASYKSKSELNTDKKVNIIYGLNGTGKSTLSNYFYDIENKKYQHCSHSGEYDEVLVYNQKFIQDNFYAKDSLNGIFSLSKENKEAKEKVESLTLEIIKFSDEKREIESEITAQEKTISDAKNKAQNKTWEIKTNYSGGDRVLEFCLSGKMGSKESLFNHLCSIPLPNPKPSKNISNLKEEASAVDGETAIKYSMLEKIDTIELSFDEVELLQDIIVGSTDSPVSYLISKLQNSDWVNEGLKYLEQTGDSQCPFCQSQTITENLVQHIRNYFDETYQNSVEKIKSIQTKYKSLIDTIPSLDTYKECKLSANQLIKLSGYYNQLSKDTESNLELIKQKIINPSNPVALADISNSVDNFNSLVELVNVEITTHNSKIDNAKDELEKIKISFWQILRHEYDQTILNFNDVKNSANNIIIQKKIEKDGKEETIKAKDEERIECQKSTVNIDEAVFNINQGLNDIGITDFYIEKYEDALYRIVRNESNSKIFSSLSEGEKMIISLLYFRELFRGKRIATEGKTRKIAIIDDPVSSLSHIFVYNIGQLIKNDFFNSDEIEQVFVLSHSLYFFYELADANHERRKETQNLFRLSKNSNGSSISLMKYDEIQNDYQSYWSVINDDKQPPALIANCMRNIIEYFFNFVQKADLSNVTQKPELKKPRFQSFIRYINRESHSLGQNIFDFKEFNYNDFKEGLRLVFEHTGYSAHYKKMAKIKN
ncbi:AAA family ATPase [Raoultella sp. C349492]|uniref:AAA family ATPase n=1 Tax=Raoultella sp. C349492 TaxID=2970253 RepID=UPI0035C6EAD6